MEAYCTRLLWAQRRVTGTTAIPFHARHGPPSLSYSRGQPVWILESKQSLQVGSTMRSCEKQTKLVQHHCVVKFLCASKRPKKMPVFSPAVSASDHGPRELGQAAICSSFMRPPSVIHPIPYIRDGIQYKPLSPSSCSVAWLLLGLGSNALIEVQHVIPS